MNAKVGVQVCDAKATKDQVGITHVHKWLLSRFTGLFCLKRDDDI